MNTAQVTRIIIIAALLVAPAVPVQAVLLGTAADPKESQSMDSKHVLRLFDLSPALFVENQGQWADESVRYVHNGNGVNVGMTDRGPVFQVFRRESESESPDWLGIDMTPSNTHTLRHRPHAELGMDSDVFLPALRDFPTIRKIQFSASFIGANDVTPVGGKRSETVFNYCIGDPSRQRENMPSYETVVYNDLYDGIDLHTWGLRSRLKYEFHVAPGADWRRIRVRYEGISGLSVSKKGSLVVDLGEEWGRMVDDAPYIYQEIDGEKVEVAGQFALIDERTYSFSITGRYDPERELVIDPDLAWSTYLGGSGWDEAYGVVADTSGNIYVAGKTYSSGWISGGYDISFNGGSGDAFVVKLNPYGAHIWSTYLGGNKGDVAYGIARDSSNNVLVTGYTDSTGWVSGGYDTSFNGVIDIFVAKLNSLGSHVWSTYLGGTNGDIGSGVAVDSTGAILITGWTYSSSGWISGGYDTTFGGQYDGFAVKLSASGLSRLWGTYLGGSSYDSGFNITSDSSNNVLVTGRTSSANWISGGYDTTYNGGMDAFVVKLNTSGGCLWSTYLGGQQEEQGMDLAIDSFNNVLVTGSTGSYGWVYGGFKTSSNGIEGFIAKLNSSGGHVWSTYIGGRAGDSGSGIAVDTAGDIFLSGQTQSSGWISGGFDTSFNGKCDTFVAKISSSGQYLLWSTYLGGSANDMNPDIAVDIYGKILVAGRTDESPSWVWGGFDTTYNGDTCDAFVAKIDASATPLPQAKLLPDGSEVEVRLAGRAISAAWADVFYVETYDRISGIRVEKTAHGLAEGMRVDVVGWMRTNPDCERYIEPSSITQSGAWTVEPLGMPNKSVGGANLNYNSSTGAGQRGVEGGFGLNNIGLLVRTWGKVVEVEAVSPQENPTWFEIDDGSGVNLKCVVPSGVTINPVGQYVMVTGISSCEKPGDNLLRLVRVRKQADIVTLKLQ